MRRLTYLLLPLLILCSLASYAQFEPPETHSINWAKTIADGTALPDTVSDKVVTRTYPGWSYFYISEPGRSSGIRVESPACPDPGDTITIVSGTMASAGDERYIASASYTITSHNTFLKPLGMTNKTFGGGDFLYDPGPPITGQKGFWDGSGLNNTGNLVRVYGRVTEIDARPIPLYCFIDDGSGVDMAIDLEVSPGQAIPFTYQVGDYIAGINGISSIITVDDWMVRTLKPSAPTVVLAKNVGQADPAHKKPIKFIANFSEPVTGFTNTDVHLFGTAQPTSCTVTDNGDHKTYIIEVSIAKQNGTVVIQVLYGAATGVDNNLSLAAPMNSSLTYQGYIPFRVINKRLGVGTGRYQRKPLK